MKHLGDICRISGTEAPTVNVIIGGSPCQDLSVAGKRAGLGGKRSGLFMEQIRIIKEMREKDAKQGRTGADIRPRFMVWENVPGAFSVNGGADFAAVLEETIRVVEQEAPDILPPAKGWTYSGCFMGDGWSVAWRVLDAQFWGVPQRRRRIALVADFGGECAPEILFERQSVSGHTQPGGTAQQGTAGDAADSTGTASAICFLERAGCPGGGKGILIQNDQTGTLSTVQNQSVCYCLQGNGIDRADTAGCNGRGWTAGSCYTLNTIDRPAVAFPINTMVATRDNPESRTTFGVGEDGDPQFTLSGAHEHAVCFSFDSVSSNSMKSSNPHSGCRAVEAAKTLDCAQPDLAKNQGGIAIVEPVCFCKTTKPHSIEEAPTITQSDVPPTLNTFDVGESRSNVYACIPEVCRTLAARYDSSPCVDRGQEFVCYESHDQDAWYRPLGEVSETVSAKYGTGGGNQPIVISCGNGQADIATHIAEEKAQTLNCMHEQQILCFDQRAFGAYMESETASTCKQRDYKDATDLVCAVDCRNGTENPDVNGTLQCKENGGTSLNLNNVVRQKYIVRRLTPLECERLQGYPDGWTDIGEWTDTKGKKRKLSDAARYKALGNSIAIPPWLYVLSRLNQYCEEKTMASLFDGIGGFPLIWEFLNGTGSAVWSSEIEDFPIAVTKIRFPERSRDEVSD